MPDLIIHCCTWNVGDDGPPKDDLNSLLGVDQEQLPDIIGIALQEVIDVNKWRSTLISYLHPKGYVLVWETLFDLGTQTKCRNLWAIFMFVFIKRNLLVAVTNIESEITTLGYGTVMGNKGAASVRFEICGVNIILICAHFHAHKHGQNDRLNDYHEIMMRQSFRDEDVHSIMDHDYVFWMGDLNFRLDGISKQQVERLIRHNEIQELLKFDQLTQSKEVGIIFQDFIEGEIEFKPTFKYDKGVDVYDTSSKQRVPAWTDRILYMAHRDFAIDYHMNFNRETTPASTLNMSRRSQIRGTPTDVEARFSGNRPEGLRRPQIVLLTYTALQQYKSSDHRPVVGIFRFSVPSLWHSLPVKFLKPLTPMHSARQPLDFLYQLLKYPELLKLSEIDSILTAKPVVQQSTIARILLLTADRLTTCESETSLNSETTTESSVFGQHVIPPPLEESKRDWIGIYPAGFADLERDFSSYIYAPQASLPPGASDAPQTNAEDITHYAGNISARHLRPLVGQQVLLVYMSRKKHCPQGYSSEVMIGD